MAMQQFDN